MGTSRKAAGSSGESGSLCDKLDENSSSRNCAIALKTNQNKNDLIPFY